MSHQLVLYVIPHLITAVISVILITRIWKRRSSSGGMQLFLFMLAIFEWSFSAAMEASAVGQATKIFWSKIEYLGAQTSPVLLLLFVLRYSDKDKWLIPWRKAALFVIPLITIFLAATNESHFLIWDGFAPGPLGTNSLIYQHGGWFWVNIVYIYMVVFTAILFLIRTALRSPRYYRSQNWSMLIATVFPWLGTSIYIFELNPWPGLDLNPISFLFTGLILTASMLHYRLLDLVPVPRDVLFENMRDGVIVLDSQKRIVDLNTRAAQYCKQSHHLVVGESFPSVFLYWPKISTCFENQTGSRVEILLGKDLKTYEEIKISPLLDRRKNSNGWLITLHDITRSKQVEFELNHSNQMLKKQLNEIIALQHQLSEQATRDSLTGLFNRRYLDDTLAREVARAKRDDQPLSLVMIDMDNLKEINDQHGHAIGDLILQAMAKLMEKKSRRSDIACRFGGDEFVMVLPGMSSATAARRTEDWLSALAGTNPSREKLKIKPTLSAGISSFPEHGQDAEALLREADKAMYAAKAAGRNRVKISG